MSHLKGLTICRCHHWPSVTECGGAEGSAQGLEGLPEEHKGQRKHLRAAGAKEAKHSSSSARSQPLSSGPHNRDFHMTGQHPVWFLMLLGFAMVLCKDVAQGRLHNLARMSSKNCASAMHLDFHQRLAT